MARLEGKSSLGRLGLLIHSTAGFIDPGWDGHVTLELSNVANLPITLYVGMRIGQLSFVQLTEPAATPYGADTIGRSTRARRVRRRAATGRTSRDPGHRGNRVRGPPRRARAPRGGPTGPRARPGPPSADAKTLANWGCELFAGDVTDAESLRRAVDGCERVIHLVAIIAEPRHEPFERIMKQGTRDLVAAAKDAGVSRFVLMSALGTDERGKDLVPYYGAKWDMEQTVKASGLDYVIFRPSFIFGKEGGILPLFMRQVRLAPVTPVAGDGKRRLQPIWVEDVARFFARSVDHAEAGGRTFDLGGPDQVTWNDFLGRLRRRLGVHRQPTVHVPIPVMRAGASIVQWLRTRR